MERAPCFSQATVWVWPGSPMLLSPSPARWGFGTLISLVAVPAEGDLSTGGKGTCALQMSLFWWPPINTWFVVTVADDVFSVF